MPVPIRTLKVRPNPWIEIGPTGLPCGVVAYEQPAGGFDPRLVGASRVNVQKLQDAPKGVPLAQEIHTFDVQYSNEDVLLPNTSYYRRRIIRGELIAADKSTYVAAGGSARGFEEQDKLLESIKSQAIRDFEAANGEGAFKALEELRVENKARSAEVAEAANADQEPKVLTDVQLEKIARAQSGEATPAPEAKPALATKKGDA